MFWKSQDKRETAHIKKHVGAMLDEFDKSVAMVRLTIDFTGPRSEEKYLLILFGFADAIGQISNIKEENVISGLQELMSDPKTYQRLVALLKQASNRVWVRKGSHAVEDSYNNNWHPGPLLKLAEDYLRNA